MEVYKEGMGLETKKTHSYIHYKLLNLAAWLSEHLEASSSTIISENNRGQDVPWEQGQKVEPREAWFPQVRRLQHQSSICRQSMSLQDYFIVSGTTDLVTIHFHGPRNNSRNSDGSVDKESACIAGDTGD